MRQSLSESGRDINVVAINILRGEPWQENLSSLCGFDLLQDVASVGAWQLMGGGKDDIFIYREGGSLAAYLPISGEVNTTLSTPDGYANVQNAIVSGDDLGPGESCPEGPPDEGGWQRPGDVNQDTELDLADGVALLWHLFVGESPLPCGEGRSSDAGNQALADLNLDGKVDVSDVVHMLRYLFLGESPPAQGTDCIRIPTCPQSCESEAP